MIKPLRETIRKMIMEVYELTNTDLASIRAEYPKYRNWSDEKIRKEIDLRGLGLQGTDAIVRDKEAMSDWHAVMKQNPSFVKDFMNGRIQIMHSLTYSGTYSDKADMYGRLPDKPFTQWINKFGRRSHDQISCVAANAAIGENPEFWSWDYGNAQHVYTEGYGFLMKGYPAFAAGADVMSQTLSAIPDTLKAFHKSSGQVKRAENITQGINPDDWKGSDEVILDNWEIIGIYIADRYYKHDKFWPLIKDAESVGLPVYKMNTTNGIMTPTR